MWVYLQKKKFIERWLTLCCRICTFFAVYIHISHSISTSFVLELAFEIEFAVYSKMASYHIFNTAFQTDLLKNHTSAWLKYGNGMNMVFLWEKNTSAICKSEQNNPCTASINIWAPGSHRNILDLVWANSYSMLHVASFALMGKLSKKRRMRVAIKLCFI